MSLSPYETARQKLLSHVLAFHTASYPSMKVDYPNLIKVDPEKDSEFVQVEISINSKQMDLSARRCLRIYGELYLNHFKRCGSGLKTFTTYTDTLFDYLGLKTLDGVTYYEVKPYNRPGLPGFDTTMNTVQFQIDYFST